MKVPHSRPWIDKEDVKAVAEVLSSGQIGQGEKVKEFETRVAKFVGTKYAIAVSSGTTALHLALISQGIGPGDEVIVPSYVCAAPFLAILHSGARPKIVDVDLSDFNICAAATKKQVTSKTKAIIVPHMFGMPAELDELLSLEIPIIEDCAQSLGAEYRNNKVGTYGRAAIFSFYATKMITTGEGGMILTDDWKIYSKILEIRDYDKKPLDILRFNYKMTDFQAAFGLCQLKKLSHFIKVRRKIASIYDGIFSKNDIKLPTSFLHKKSVFYRYVIVIKEKNRVQKAARKKGIICENPVWKPIHKSLGLSDFPNSDYGYEHALSIPLYPSLTRKEIKYIEKNLGLLFK